MTITSQKLKELITEGDFFKDPFKFYGIQGVDEQAINQFNDIWNDDPVQYNPPKLPRMAFYDIEATQSQKGFPDPKETPVDSIATYDVNTNTFFTQVTLLPYHRRLFGRTEERATANIQEQVDKAYLELVKTNDAYKLLHTKELPKIKVSARFDEGDMILEFWDNLKEIKPLMLCGFNSRNFDDSYMLIRTQQIFGQDFQTVMSRFGEVHTYSNDGDFSIPDFELVDIQKLMLPVDAGGLAYTESIVGGHSLDNYATQWLGAGKLKFDGSFFEQYKYNLIGLLNYGNIDVIHLPNLWYKKGLSAKIFPIANSNETTAISSTAGKVRMTNFKNIRDHRKLGLELNSMSMMKEYNAL